LALSLTLSELPTLLAAARLVTFGADLARFADRAGKWESFDEFASDGQPARSASGAPAGDAFVIPRLRSHRALIRSA
jgi:hypothetical protein